MDLPRWCISDRFFYSVSAIMGSWRLRFLPSWKCFLTKTLFCNLPLDFNFNLFCIIVREFNFWREEEEDETLVCIHISPHGKFLITDYLSCHYHGLIIKQSIKNYYSCSKLKVISFSGTFTKVWFFWTEFNQIDSG